MPNEPQEWTSKRVLDELPDVPVRLTDGTIITARLSRISGGVTSFVAVWVPWDLVSTRWVHVTDFYLDTVVAALNNDRVLAV